MTNAKSIFSVIAFVIASGLGLVAATQQDFTKAFDRLLGQMAGRSFDLMLVNDRVAGDFIRNGADLYGAREAVLDEWVCRPIFGETHRDHKRCFELVYRVNMGGVDRELQKAGVPASTIPQLRQARAGMMGLAKKFLAMPTQARFLYKERKPAMVAAFRALEPAKQQEVLKNIEKTKLGLENYKTTRVLDADSLFAYRREGDGGVPLVRVYKEATTDLLVELKK